MESLNLYQYPPKLQSYPSSILDTIKLKAEFTITQCSLFNYFMLNPKKEACRNTLPRRDLKTVFALKSNCV